MGPKGLGGTPAPPLARACQPPLGAGRARRAWSMSLGGRRPPGAARALADVTRYAAALSRLLRTRGGASLLARPRGVTEAEPVKFGLRQAEIVGTNVGKNLAVEELLLTVNNLR